MNYIKIKGIAINLDNVSSIHGLDREEGKLFFDFGSADDVAIGFGSQEERQRIVDALLYKIGLGKGQGMKDSREKFEAFHRAKAATMINESGLERRITAKQDFINEYVAENIGEYQDNSDCTMEAIENASDEMLKKLFDAISESKAAQTVVDCIVDTHLVEQAEEAWGKEAGL